MAAANPGATGSSSPKPGMPAPAPAAAGSMGTPQAVDANTLWQFFLAHRHGGNGPTDGALLQGPFFLVDEVTGKLQKLTLKNGVLLVGGKPAYTGPTRQNVMTASRVLGTTYQNNTGKSMWVNVITTGDGGVAAYSDNSTSPNTLVSQNNTTAGDQDVSFLVLPGNYYKAVSINGAGLVEWVEYY